MEANITASVCLPHLPAPHEGEVLDDGLAHVLQPLELHLQRLQLGRVTQVLVVLCLHPVLRSQEHLGQVRSYIFELE